MLQRVIIAYMTLNLIIIVLIFLERVAIMILILIIMMLIVVRMRDIRAGKLEERQGMAPVKEEGKL